LHRHRGFLNRLRRQLRYRLVIPILRGKHSPEYTARGVLFGLLAAMTPTVGIQMPIVFITWCCVRVLRPSWDFNLVVGLAWTWVTNILTVPPMYYVFLVTGRLMTGHFDALTGYDMFQERLATLLDANAVWYEAVWVYIVGMFEIWGVPMFLGCLPWAALSGWLGYRWSLRLIREFRLRRVRRAVLGGVDGTHV
jgi:uncharacterized protein (DUF2062 family)